MAMTIDGAFAVKILTTFIREELGKAGFSKGVLGLSGRPRFVGVRLPRRPGPRAEERPRPDHALRRKLRRRHRTTPGTSPRVLKIRTRVDRHRARWSTPISRSIRPTDRVRIGNKMARERMSILYDFSAREKALILGTSNKTELLIGYGTIHGDMACAINPLGDLYKTQVRQLAGRARGPRTDPDQGSRPPACGPARRTRARSA